MTPRSRYETVSLDTCPPHLLVAHLLNRAIHYTEVAERALGKGDVANCHEELMRAQQVIRVLRTGLRPDAAPELASSLDRVYEWAGIRLVDANVRKDMANLEDVRMVLRTLESAWRQAGDLDRTSPATELAVHTREEVGR